MTNHMGPAPDIRTCTLEQLQDAYDSLPNRRSLYAQALAEIIRERQQAEARVSKAPSTTTEPQTRGNT
ncbi:MAG: hypothetical protein ACREYA_22945 [Cupriavidus necator]